MNIAIQDSSFMCDHASRTPISAQKGYISKRPSDFGAENGKVAFVFEHSKRSGYRLLRVVRTFRGDS